MSGAGPIADPAAPAWKLAPAGQGGHAAADRRAAQSSPSPPIRELTVRAAHNGGWIAFLIEWKDPTLSDRIVLDNFGDQVAVELPVDIKADPAVAR